MSRWYLYVDETGDFAAGNSTCGVTGLLVDHSLHAQSLRRVRSAWEALVPEVPWPPHSTTLRRPLAWVAWQGRGRRAGWRQAALALQDLLADLPAWSDIRAAILAGKSISDGAMHLCQSHALLHGHMHYQVLAQRGREVRDVQTELLRILAESGHLRVVVAAPADKQPRDAGDAYLGLLAALLRRAGDAVLNLAGAGEHELFAVVLGRDVWDERLHLRVHLARPHLADACVAAAQDPLACMHRDAVHVNLLPDRVLRFDAEAPEFSMLADAAANRTFGVLQVATHDLASRCAAITRATAVPCSLPGGTLPLTASDGLPQDHIEVARRGGHLAESRRQLTLSKAFPWAREQAGMWADYLARREDR